MKIIIAEVLVIVVAFWVSAAFAERERVQRSNAPNVACSQYLEKAKRKIATSRERVWVGKDGLRVAAVEDLVDYLACIEK